MEFRLLILFSLLVNCTSGTWHAFVNYEYYISTSGANFDGAQSACERMDANLAKVNTSEIQQFLTDTINSTSGSLNTLYIGLMWKNSTNKYHWFDGTMLDAAQWGTGQPSSNETCVVMAKNSSYLWDDVSCDNSTSYICSKYSETATTDAAPTTTENKEATTLSSGKITVSTTTITTTKLTTTSTNSNAECCSCANDDDLNLTTVILTALISGVVFICIVESLVIWKITRNAEVNTLAPPKVNHTERQVNFDEPKRTNKTHAKKPLQFEEDESGYLKPNTTYPLQNLEDDQGYIEFSPS